VHRGSVAVQEAKEGRLKKRDLARCKALLSIF
jgi:hypothetical protein